jgi:hypothetical protein
MMAVGAIFGAEVEIELEFTALQNYAHVCAFNGYSADPRS